MMYSAQEKNPQDEYHHEDLWKIYVTRKWLFSRRRFT